MEGLIKSGAVSRRCSSCIELLMRGLHAEECARGLLHVGSRLRAGWSRSSHVPILVVESGSTGNPIRRRRSTMLMRCWFLPQRPSTPSTCRADASWPLCNCRSPGDAASTTEDSSRREPRQRHHSPQWTCSACSSWSRSSPACRCECRRPDSPGTSKRCSCTS
jgi:hypothetical protein